MLVGIKGDRKQIKKVRRVPVEFLRSVTAYRRWEIFDDTSLRHAFVRSHRMRRLKQIDVHARVTRIKFPGNRKWCKRFQRGRVPDAVLWNSCVRVCAKGLKRSVFGGKHAELFYVVDIKVVEQHRSRRSSHVESRGFYCSSKHVQLVECRANRNGGPPGPRCAVHQAIR